MLSVGQHDAPLGLFFGSPAFAGDVRYFEKRQQRLFTIRKVKQSFYMIAKAMRFFAFRAQRKLYCISNISFITFILFHNAITADVV